MDKRQFVVCRFFQVGYCHRSRVCLYAHSLHPPTPESILNMAPTASTLFSKTDPAQAGEEDNEGSETSLEEIACAVCYDVPGFYGLLQNCSHAFCLPCLKKWRSRDFAPRPDDDDDDLQSASKTCPLCREPSAFVVPVSRFFVEGDEKKQVIKRYKQNLKRKKCKYWTTSLDRDGRPSCPFKDSCFYSLSSPERSEQLQDLTDSHKRTVQRIMLKSLFGIAGPNDAARTLEETDAAVAQLLYIFGWDDDDDDSD